MSRKPVVLQWSMSSTFGWGVYGLNVGLNWATDPDIAPVFSMDVSESAIVLDALRAQVLAPVLRQSHAFAAQLQPYAGKAVRMPGTVVHALGDGLEAAPSAHDIFLTGDSTLGAVFFANTEFDSAARGNARRYDLIICGATWNREILDGKGIGPAVTVLQGIDPTLFHPAPRTGLYAQRFLVFSGGKLEYRKGQDLVLLAFKAFVERHPEALLVTAWHSPWPQFARSLDASGSGAAALPFTDAGVPDVVAWAAANGIPRQNVLDLGVVPNANLPTVLREMDVALFPNRAEPGTNLVAMECIACGVPTILSANTGHLDLTAPGRCIALERQRRVRSAQPGTEGWGESDIDEMVEALERVWRDRSAAAEIGAAGARFMSELTWANQTRRLKQAILPYLA